MLQALLVVAGPSDVRRHLAPPAEDATGIKEAMLCKT
jgi:hypothetical protein